MESLEMMPARVRITSILKKALLAGEYKSGQELSLTEIAEKLGVSRTPVREAFQTLAAEGLIELRMNKGAIVKQIDQKFITDHYEMRILLESEAAVRAARNGMDVSELLARLYHLTDNLSTLDLSLIHIFWRHGHGLRRNGYGHDPDDGGTVVPGSGDNRGTSGRPGAQGSISKGRHP